MVEEYGRCLQRLNSLHTFDSSTLSRCGYDKMA